MNDWIDMAEVLWVTTSLYIELLLYATPSLPSNIPVTGAGAGRNVKTGRWSRVRHWGLKNCYRSAECAI
jgi:hypothetical protein